MVPTNKWGRAFWRDFGERVGSTFLGALLACITLTGTTPVDWTDAAAVWAVLGVPTATAVIKALLANMANPETGASLLASPPGPVEHGYVSAAVAIIAGLGVLLVALLTAAPSWALLLGVLALAVVIVACGPRVVARLRM